uniref:Protein ovary overexpressed n=1 Tax=Rhipicephalus microplus TaxID=6941 RepID=A0A6M2CZI6_RHIMP
MATETGVCSEHTSDTLPNDNPLLLMSYVHKLVRVETTEGDVLAGYVKTVDPISKSVVLVLFEDGKAKVLHVIMGHAVKSVTVVTDASPAEKEQIETLFMLTQKELSAEELRQRKENVRSWMCVNRIPIAEATKEPGTLVIAGSVRLLPPYGPDDLQCTNSLVLGKIHRMISLMPSDVESWMSPYEPIK